MLKKLFFISAGFVIAMIGCKNLDAGQNDRNDEHPTLLTLPTVPSILRTDTERNMYLLERYWKGFRWDDTTLVESKALNQVLIDWINLLYSVPEADAARVSHHIITDGAGHPDMQKALFNIAESALNDPNSPYRNDEMFIPILKAVCADSLIDDISKARPIYVLGQLEKNRKGTIAKDLEVTRADGSQIQLSGWIKSKQYTLIYFFNPDCHDCERVGSILQNDNLIDSLVGIGQLGIAAIYPDEDLTSWNEHNTDKYHGKWLVGRLASDTERSKYYLPAIPNLYLIDKDCRVLLKDASIESIIDYIRRTADSRLSYSD